MSPNTTGKLNTRHNSEGRQEQQPRG